MSSKEIVGTTGLSDLVFQYVEVGAADVCWEWLARRNASEYGTVKHNGRSLLAHRAVYACIHGVTPAGLVVRHTCDNPPCCNPNHLLLGTVRDNVHDSISRGRRAGMAGEKNPRAKLTEDDVRKIRAEWGRDSSRGRQRALAEQFGVSSTMIGWAVSGRTWSHVA